MTKQLAHNVYAIDSYSLYIPLSAILNDLNAFFPEITILEDGVIIEEKTGNLEIERHGIKVNLTLYKNPYRGTFIQTVITAKMLGKRYFEGLNLSNFQETMSVLQDLTGLILDVNEVLEKGFINDIDICYNMQYTRSEWQERLLYFNDLAGVKRFRKDFNEIERRVLIGLQFVNRRDASISKPFIKFYDKEDELRNNSDVFRKNYLSEFQYNNMKRIEVTIKNSTHIEALSKALSLDLNNTISSFLSLNQDNLKAILIHMLNKHLEFYSPKNRERKKSNQTPTRQLIGALCVHLHRETGKSLDDLYNIVNTLDFGNSNNASSRLRATIRESIKDYRSRTGVFDFDSAFKDFK